MPRRLKAKEALGAKIREVRSQAHYSQAMFAEAIGLRGSQAQVSRWERAEEAPSYESVLKISEAFQVPLEEFQEDAAVDGQQAVENSSVHEPPQDAAAGLASLLGDRAVLAALLSRLAVGDVVAALYGVARELGWSDDQMAELDAAATAALRSTSMEEVEADRRRWRAELLAAKDRLRAETAAPEQRPYNEGRSLPRRRRGA